MRVKQIGITLAIALFASATVATTRSHNVELNEKTCGLLEKVTLDGGVIPSVNLFFKTGTLYSFPQGHKHASQIKAEAEMAKNKSFVFCIGTDKEGIVASYVEDNAEEAVKK